MKASIIVPTLNRSTSLRKALCSIILQTFPAEQFEIIVVDNGSTDSTRKTVQALIENHQHHKIRYAFEREHGLLAARHRGVLEAMGELLIFIDDDVEASPGWLRAIVEGFENAEVQLIGGRNLPTYEIDPPEWIESFWDTTAHGGCLCWYLSLIDLGEERFRMRPSYIWGLNFSIRRQAFYDLGGFHPDECFHEGLQRFDGDGESGLTMAAEARGVLAHYEPAAVVYHFVPAARMTLDYFERRAFLQGIRDSYTNVRLNRGISIPLGAQARRVAYDVVVYTKRVGRAAMTFRPEKRKIAKMHKRVAAAYRAGFDYHQRIIRADPRVHEWVLRPYYWNYRLPI